MIDRDLLRLSGRLFRPVLGRGSLALLYGCLTILSAVGLLGTSAYLVTYAALQPSIAYLQVAIIGVRFFGIARAVFRYLERIESHSVNLQLVGSLRSWVYGQLKDRLPAAASRYETGDLLDRAIADVATLEQLFVRVMAPPAVAAVVSLVTAALLYLLHPQLGWLALAVYGTAGTGVLLLSVRGHGARQREYAERRSALAGHLAGLVQGVADLRVNGREDVFRDRTRAVQARFSRLQRSGAGLSAGLDSLLTLLSGWSLVLFLAVAARLHSSNLLDGRLVPVAALLALAGFESFQNFPGVGLFLTQSLQAGRRLLDLTSQPPQTREPDHPASLPRLDSLEVHDLVFQYPGGAGSVLNGLSLELPRGTRIALVGASGAGKTSLVNLLLRFWEYQSGSIRVNGREIREFDRAALRSRIRASSQRPFFFPGPIRENLLLAAPNAGADELRQALKAAQCEEWVAGLPGGLEAEIAEWGRALSEGQRRRLDIARAILGDPDLLILDEPLAGLDPLTGERLLRSLIQSTAQRSLILITHQLTGLELMDEVLLLQGGRVVERGTHAELLHRQGEYARMAALQSDRIDTLP